MRILSKLHIWYSYVLPQNQYTKGTNGFPGCFVTVLQTANFQHGGEEELALLKELQPGRPLMVAEFWTGWYDHWLDEAHSTWELSGELLTSLAWLVDEWRWVGLSWLVDLGWVWFALGCVRYTLLGQVRLSNIRLTYIAFSSCQFLSRAWVSVFDVSYLERRLDDVTSALGFTEASADRALKYRQAQAWRHMQRYNGILGISLFFKMISDKFGTIKIGKLSVELILYLWHKLFLTRIRLHNKHVIIGKS